jgi:hypothetical protein
MAAAAGRPDAGDVTETRTVAGLPADAMDRMGRARAARDEADKARVPRRSPS